MKAFDTAVLAHRAAFGLAGAKKTVLVSQSPVPRLSLANAAGDSDQVPCLPGRCCRRSPPAFGDPLAPRHVCFPREGPRIPRPFACSS
jgi:hypothetical protein